LLESIGPLVFEKTDKVNGSRHILRGKTNYLRLSGIKIACYMAVQATNKRKEYVFHHHHVPEGLGMFPVP